MATGAGSINGWVGADISKPWTIEVRKDRDEGAIGVEAAGAMADGNVG